jgi:hypothetical protein
MKTLIILTLATILAGCSAETYTTTESYILPQGMEDCKIYEMSPNEGDYGVTAITVVRCPNSDVSIKENSNHGRHIAIVETPNDSIIDKINKLEEELDSIKSKLE